MLRALRKPAGKHMKQKIYKANIDNGYVFTADKMFYVEDEFISVE